MASTAEQNLKDYKSLMGKNNACYLAIKPQYVGSWHDDIQNLATLTGTTPEKLIEQNPWLTSNSYPANDHDYTILKVKSGGKSGTSSDSSNTPSSGYYVGDGWIFPLGVGTWYCTTGYSAEHKALDFTTGVAGRIEGSPIYATKAGTIVQCYTSDTYGNTILIRHDETKDSSGNCYYSRYAHLLTLPDFKAGDKVSAGDKIANVGGRPGTVGAGTSTGAHLHFGLYWTSATRTDYTSFTARADFAVNPNNIEGFPGAPWTQGQRNEVQFTKSPYITEEEMETVQKAGRVNTDETVPEEEKVPESTLNTITDNVTNRICKAGDITDSDQKKLVKDFIDAQIKSIANNGFTYASELIATGDVWATFDRICKDVVNNAKWYMESKVTEAIVNASDEAKKQAKAGLRSWVYNATDIDPESEWGKDVGNLLDGYFDTCVTTTWGAVQTAITTGDVSLALQSWVTSTKNTSIDFAAEVTLHGTATALTAYIPTLLKKTGDATKDEQLAKASIDLAIGCTNTIVTSIAGWLKGDISLVQASKNILSYVALHVGQYAISYYIAPKLSTYVTSWLTTAITTELSKYGITIGEAVAGPLGAVIGLVVSFVISALLNFLLEKLVGMFQQP